ncbi:hypothetical protein ACQ4PT_046311 [Festuca glaucescens]
MAHEYSLPISIDRIFHYTKNYYYQYTKERRLLSTKRCSSRLTDLWAPKTHTSRVSLSTPLFKSGTHRTHRFFNSPCLSSEREEENRIANPPRPTAPPHPPPAQHLHTPRRRRTTRCCPADWADGVAARRPGAGAVGVDLVPVVAIQAVGGGGGDEGPAAIQHLLFFLLLLVPEGAVLAAAGFLADPPQVPPARRLVGLLPGGVREIGRAGFGSTVGVACRGFLVVVLAKLGPVSSHGRSYGRLLIQK